MKLCGPLRSVCCVEFVYLVCLFSVGLKHQPAQIFIFGSNCLSLVLRMSYFHLDLTETLPDISYQLSLLMSPLLM